MKNKIFIRPTMEKGRDQKPKDEKARKRNTIINESLNNENQKLMQQIASWNGLLS